MVPLSNEDQKFRFRKWRLMRHWVSTVFLLSLLVSVSLQVSVSRADSDEAAVVNPQELPHPATLEPRFDRRPRVIYIGGSGATAADVAKWKQGVENIPEYSSNFVFEARAIAPRAWKRRQVQEQNAKLIQELVEQIDNSPPGAKFILSGHSSGSAVSNEVARRVRDKSKVSLVILDGFFPRNISNQVEKHCWFGVDASRGLLSRNAEGMKACRKSHAVKSKGCRDSMCLHFSMVNSSAARLGINGGNYKLKGYQDLEPNLDWLEDFLPAADRDRSVRSDSQAKPPDARSWQHPQRPSQ